MLSKVTKSSLERTEQQQTEVHGDGTRHDTCCKPQADVFAQALPCGITTGHLRDNYCVCCKHSGLARPAKEDCHSSYLFLVTESYLQPCVLSQHHHSEPMELDLCCKAPQLAADQRQREVVEASEACWAAYGSDHPLNSASSSPLSAESASRCG